MLLHLLVRLLSLSEDQDRARVAPVQCEQRWGRKNGAGILRVTGGRRVKSTRTRARVMKIRERVSH